MRISIIGVPYAGKDAVANILCAKRGFVRYALGDVIKAQLQPFLRGYGFNAFESDPAKKNHLRPILEAWSEVNAQNVLATYHSTMPAGNVVNPRMVRVEEFDRWVAAGGLVIEVTRPGTKPASKWESDNLAAIRGRGGVFKSISNDGSLEQLEQKVLSWLDPLQAEGFDPLDAPDCATLVGYEQPEADRLAGEIRRYEKKIVRLKERLAQVQAAKHDEGQLKFL